MKKFTSAKWLAVTAGLLLTAGSANAKVATPDGGNIIISKVFYSASKGAESGNYPYGQYIELFNNSADTVNVAGLYVGLIESESGKNAYTADTIAQDDALKAQFNGKVVLKQVFQIPAAEPRLLASGESLILCNSAIDHTALAQVGHDLSKADYEVKTINTKYQHNDAVPALDLVFTFNASTDFMNLSYSGPCSIVLLKNNAKAIDLTNPVFALGKDKGNQYVLGNLYYCVDAVDILNNVKNKGVDPTTKRLNSTYDAGFAATVTAGTYTGETVYRKTAFASGRTFLFDTNNSSTDFASSATIQPRAYDTEVAGLSEATIVIPETGYLVFRPEKTFFGPRNLTFTYLTGNQKNSDLTYNNFPGDSLLLAETNYIAIGVPGTYTVRLSEAQPMQKVPSNMLTWSDDDTKELTGGQKNRSIYKFQNQPSGVGFQRVPQAADGGYNVADFTDGNRLYLTLTPAMVTAFWQACGAESEVAFDYIPWHGPTPDQYAGIQHLSTSGQHSALPAYYDLTGRRITGKPSRGLYIDKATGKKLFATE
jgi:hypothetical protein